MHIETDNIIANLILADKYKKYTIYQQNKY